MLIDWWYKPAKLQGSLDDMKIFMPIAMASLNTSKNDCLHCTKVIENEIEQVCALGCIFVQFWSGQKVSKSTFTHFIKIHKSEFAIQQCSKQTPPIFLTVNENIYGTTRMSRQSRLLGFLKVKLLYETFNITQFC